MNSAVLEKGPGVQALSRDEKWELMGLLWEDLGYRDDERDLAIREVLSERAAGYRANPSDVRSWEEVQRRFEEKNQL